MRFIEFKIWKVLKMFLSFEKIEDQNFSSFEALNTRRIGVKIPQIEYSLNVSLKGSVYKIGNYFLDF